MGLSMVSLSYEHSQPTAQNSCTGLEHGSRKVLMLEEKPPPKFIDNAENIKLQHTYKIYNQKSDSHESMNYRLAGKKTASYFKIQMSNSYQVSEKQINH